MTLLDTNIVIDLFAAAGNDTLGWSSRRYEDALRRGPIGCNLIVVAELAAKAADAADILERLAEFQIDIFDLPIEAAFPAGRAFADYRRRGGNRTAILPDFLIAGHADAIGASFVTRDRRLGVYFPGLAVITPETHP